MVIRGALQGWQAFDNKQKQEAAFAVEHAKGAKDALNTGGIAGLRSYYADTDSAMKHYNIPPLEGLMDRMSQMDAAGAPAGAPVQPPGAGLPQGGAQPEAVPTREQAMRALAGMPPEEHMLAGYAAPSPGAYPTEMPSAVPSEPPPPIARPVLGPGAEPIDIREDPGAAAAWQEPFEPVPEMEEGIAAAEAAPAAPVSRTETAKKVLDSPPESLGPQQVKRLAKYAGKRGVTGGDLKALKVEADLLKEDRGAEWDGKKWIWLDKKGNRTAVKKFSKPWRILEQDRRVDKYIEESGIQPEAPAEAETPTPSTVGEVAASLERPILSDEEYRDKALADVAKIMQAHAAAGEREPPDVFAPPTLPDVREPKSIDVEDIYNRAIDQGMSPTVALAHKRTAEMENAKAKEAYKEEVEAARWKFDAELKLYGERPKLEEGKRRHELKFTSLDPIIKGGLEWDLKESGDQDTWLKSAALVFPKGTPKQKLINHYKERGATLEAERRLKNKRLLSKMHPINVISQLETMANLVRKYDPKTAAIYRGWAADYRAGRKLNPEGLRILEDYAGAQADAEEIKRLETRANRLNGMADRLSNSIIGLVGLKDKLLTTPEQEEELKRKRTKRDKVEAALDRTNSTLELLGRERPHARSAATGKVNPEDPLSPFRGEDKTAYIMRMPTGEAGEEGLRKYRDEMGW